MLNTEQIIDDIVDLSAGKTIWVAYSGGVDSRVLLHLLAMAEHPHVTKINAIHIDHGLHPDSTQWAQHCAGISTELNVNFKCITVNVKDIKTHGTEAAARTARYQAFQQQLTQNDVLLTAQHQQDQSETLLLQLLRGAGPKGLSAMAQQFQLGKTTVIRPLLNVTQADVLAYAQHHQLQWIDDPSNIETRWNRNYIRHNIWPVIEERWPAAATTLSRSAEHCAEASELMTELAKMDMAKLAIDSWSESLPISSLLTLSPARYKNVLRYFIECKQLLLPSTSCLQRVIDEVCLAKQDSMPLVSWAGVDVRRYQDQLYFMPALAEHDVNQMLECNDIDDLYINTQCTLSWQQQNGKGLKKDLITAGLNVRFRQGGERIQLPKQTHHKTLKHLFQQWAIPPWQRDRIPLLFDGDQLVAVAGYAVDKKSSVLAGEQGYFPLIKIN